MKRSIFVTLAILCLSGCATQAPTTTLEEVYQPEIDTVQQAELGDTLVKYVIAGTRPSYKLLETFQYLNTPPVNAGTILTPTTSDNTYEGFANSGLCRHINTGDWCVGGMNAFGTCNAFTCALGGVEVKVTPAKWIDPSMRNIDQQLIYNGRVGNMVRFTYREFTATGLARDAFSQDIQYDLDEGDVIGFKGARIQIVEASNRTIQYKVLAHFPSQLY
jgi:hypothetical protein